MNRKRDLSFGMVLIAAALGLGAPAVAADGPATHSKLWGTARRALVGRRRGCPDFSYAGYHRGEAEPPGRHARSDRPRLRRHGRRPDRRHRRLPTGHQGGGRQA